MDKCRAQSNAREEIWDAKVIGRSKDNDGNMVGAYHENPLLNTIIMMLSFLMER